MGKKKKSGYTRRETDLLGREKEVHYNEAGEKIGETRFKDKPFRGRVQEHYDDSGEKVGETRKGSDWLGRDRAEHFDSEGERIGQSRDETNFWGQSIQRHYDKESGDEVGVSRRTDEIDLGRGWHGFGPRKEHRGRHFKAEHGSEEEDVEAEEERTARSGSWGGSSSSSSSRSRSRSSAGGTGGGGGSGCFTTILGVILLVVGTCCLLITLNAPEFSLLGATINNSAEPTETIEVIVDEEQSTAEGFSVEAEPTVAVEEKVTDSGGEGFQVYVVRRGDTLWDIAEEHYGSGYEWTRIRDANKDVIGYMPDGTQKLIVPGQELVLP